MSFTLVFSQGKPCCKSKSGNGKLSCKLNHAKIDTKDDGTVITDGSLVTSNAVVQCPNKPGCTGCKCSKSVTTNEANQKKCASCTNAKWWQFWVKKKSCCSTKS